MAEWLKNLPANQATRVWFLGQEDLQQEEMATHSSILPWTIPWTEESGRPQSMGLQRVRQDWTHIYLFWPRCMACEVLVPWPGIEPEPPALKAWSLNPWIAREVLPCLSMLSCVRLWSSSHLFLACTPWPCTSIHKSGLSFSFLLQIVLWDFPTQSPCELRVVMV